MSLIWEAFINITYYFQRICLYFLENLVVHSTTLYQACLWEHDLPDDVSSNRSVGGLEDHYQWQNVWIREIKN